MCSVDSWDESLVLGWLVQTSTLGTRGAWDSSCTIVTQIREESWLGLDILAILADEVGHTLDWRVVSRWAICTCDAWPTKIFLVDRDGSSLTDKACIRRGLPSFSREIAAGTQATVRCKGRPDFGRECAWITSDACSA